MPRLARGRLSSIMACSVARQQLAVAARAAERVQLGAIEIGSMRFITRELQQAMQNLGVPQEEREREWSKHYGALETHLETILPDLPECARFLAENTLHDGVVESASRSSKSEVVLCVDELLGLYDPWRNVVGGTVVDVDAVLEIARFALARDDIEFAVARQIRDHDIQRRIGLRRYYARRQREYPVAVVVVESLRRSAQRADE